jgi:hypothetical protein
MVSGRLKSGRPAYLSFDVIATTMAVAIRVRLKRSCWSTTTGRRPPSADPTGSGSDTQTTSPCRTTTPYHRRAGPCGDGWRCRAQLAEIPSALWLRPIPDARNFSSSASLTRCLRLRDLKRRRPSGTTQTMDRTHRWRISIRKGARPSRIGHPLSGSRGRRRGRAPERRASSMARSSHASRSAGVRARATVNFRRLASAKVVHSPALDDRSLIAPLSPRGSP